MSCKAEVGLSQAPIGRSATRLARLENADEKLTTATSPGHPHNHGFITTAIAPAVATMPIADTVSRSTQAHRPLDIHHATPLQRRLHLV